MTTPDILKSPVRVYKDRVAVYFFDGRVQADIIGPAGPERDAVLALVGRAQALAKELRHLVRLLEPLEKDGSLDVPGLATLNGSRKALHDAGVMSEADATQRGT